MMKSVRFALFLLICYATTAEFCCCDSNNNQELDYYWRDYYGNIPTDAVPGGRDRAGNDTYIGQAWDQDGGMLPGTITRGKLEIRYLDHGKESISTKYIKILSARNVNKITWIPTTSNNMSLVTNCHIISGGVEPPWPLYIGRTNHMGRTVVGKVFDPISEWDGVWIPYQGGQVNYTCFELLTYDCNK